MRGRWRAYVVCTRHKCDLRNLLGVVWCAPQAGRGKRTIVNNQRGGSQQPKEDN